ncbi:MAG: XDD4 family exosortase-dependent surface protein [Phycisphaerales bacterium JB038]
MKAFAFCAASLVAAAAANADIVYMYHGSGLAVEAEFTLLDPTTLEIRLCNISTAVPGDFDNSDQILTGISWDFGLPGMDPGDVTIVGGSVLIGGSSHAMNFDTGAYGPGDDVSGEYGYSNIGTTGMLPNMLTGNESHATPFGGLNLDGSDGLNGPQGGMVADPLLVDLGGLGAIHNEIIATLYLSAPLSSLDFLYDTGVIAEFGSDAKFIPAPGSALLLGLSALAARRRRG